MGDFLNWVNWCGAPTPTVGGAVSWSVPRAEWNGERVCWAQSCVHESRRCEQPLQVPLLPQLCCHHELWAGNVSQVSPFSFKWLSSRQFFHNRKETKAVVWRKMGSSGGNGEHAQVTSGRAQEGTTSGDTNMGAKDKSPESLLSFHHTGPEDRTVTVCMAPSVFLQWVVNSKRNLWMSFPWNREK